MARFGGGWIKLWRRAVEGDLADNMYLWGIWNWLLYAAHWKPSSIIWKGARRDIPAGTVILGIAELAEKWDCSQATIKKWLTYLKTSERIALETCSRGTLVTILNWDTYQNPYAEQCEPSENQVGAGCEPSENQVGLIEEGKKVRKKEGKGKADELPPLAVIWNENCGSLPRVNGCSSTRMKSVQARWAEQSDPSYWTRVVSILSGSEFCNGKNERRWRADFDFLIQPDTQHKALEGKYGAPIKSGQAGEDLLKAYAVEKAAFEAQAHAEDIG